ncbi:MAG: hypothetical protein FK731_13050 [Asgard group archaeon]|nr:hypothetical protein [Asgard group archaeon]
MKIGIPILIVGMFLSMTIVRSDYNVAVGNTFNYDVGVSSWDVTLGTNTSSGAGFNFLDVKRAVGSTFEVEVTAVDPLSGVNWDMTLGTDTDSGSNTPFDGLGVIFLLILPVLFAESTVGSWDQADMDLGPELFSFFFIDPDTWEDFFYEISQEGFISSISDPDYEFVNVGGTFDNSSTIAVFTWHFDMTYTSVGYDYSGTFVWMHAFDKNTGHMKGYYMDMDYSGTVAGESLTYKLEQKVEEVGYNLPAVGGFIPGFEWFIAIPALAVLGGVAIIIRKRK